MRALFGIIWFFVICAAIFAGGPYIAGQIASRRHENAISARRDTSKTLRSYHAVIEAGVGLLTIMGCGAGILPGTRTSQG